MTKRKFIIISFHQLSPRWISYFHLDELVGDIDVEYWDCSSWMEYGDVLPEKIERPYCHVFKSEEELRDAVYALPAGCYFRILHRFFKLDWLIEWLYQSRSEFIMVEFIPPSHMAEPNLHQRFSKIVEILYERNSTYEYTDLSTFMQEASFYDDIVQWGSKNSAWKSFNILARYSIESGYKRFSEELLKVIAQFSPEKYWQRDAVLILENINQY